MPRRGFFLVFFAYFLLVAVLDSQDKTSYSFALLLLILLQTSSHLLVAFTAFVCGFVARDYTHFITTAFCGAALVTAVVALAGTHPNTVWATDIVGALVHPPPHFVFFATLFLAHIVNALYTSVCGDDAQRAG